MFGLCFRTVIKYGARYAVEIGVAWDAGAERLMMGCFESG